MNAEAFRQLYDYHFDTNRKIWDRHIMRLSQAQFVEEVDYSVGSIRNQVVHMLSVDNGWFSSLHGEGRPPMLNPMHYPEREKIREEWDSVENKMREYLDRLQDEMLFTQPFPEQKPMLLWQVLIHVMNHGTDHRAQLLFLLNKQGLDTTAQDYLFHILGSL